MGACICFGVAHYFIADPTLLCSDCFTGRSLDLSKKKKKGFTKKIQLLLVQHCCFVSSLKLSLGLHLDQLQRCLMPEQVPSCKMGISVSFSCTVIIVTTKAKGELKCFCLMLTNIFLTGYGAKPMWINYTILEE